MGDLDQFKLENKATQKSHGRTKSKAAFLEVASKRIQSSKEVLLLCLTELVYSAHLDFKSCSMPAEKFGGRQGKNHIIGGFTHGSRRCMKGYDE